MEYDVFISSKSEDYPLAEQVYDYLSENGIRAFLASRELRKMGEADYGDAIDSVLDSSYHMIIVSSSADNLKSRWVKIEWGSFLNEMLSGRKQGQIMTLLDNMTVSELPVRLRNFESFTKDNYKAGILKYVETPSSIARKQQAEEDEAAARRRKEVEFLIKSKESEYALHARQLESLSKEIVDLHRKIGNADRTCPVCGRKSPIDAWNCGKCGWPFNLVYETDQPLDQNYLQFFENAKIQNPVQAEKSDSTNRTHSEPTGQKTESPSSRISKDEIITVNGVSFKMIYVEGGTFKMGSDSGDTDEKPVHEVTISSYHIGETEVTQQLWEAVMGRNPSRFIGSQNPVEEVSWDDCQSFMSRLNSLTGRQFRLPTEAEWEFAARGGNKTNGCEYSGSNDIDEVAWYWGNSRKKTHAVKTKSPNELGIYDMSGNVWEWCNDWKGDYPSTSVTNPTGLSSASSRVLRGGSWFVHASHCRISIRGGNIPSHRDDILGLRLAF